MQNDLSRVQALVDALAYPFHGRPCKCPECQTARKLVSDAPALMEELRERLEWRPIESAPFNQSILIYLPNAEHYGPGIYRAIRVDMGTGEHWHTTAWAYGRDIRELPIAWMPLPPAPTNSNDGAAS